MGGQDMAGGEEEEEKRVIGAAWQVCPQLGLNRNLLV